MKRSQINKAIKQMEQCLERLKIVLPPFCYWTPQDWKTKGHEYDEIRDNMLGWDVTDYGCGRFDELGFTLITLRNGNIKRCKEYPKPFAEKLLYIREGQYSPLHFHFNKMEDIINRGGGNVFIRVYKAAEDGSLEKSDVKIMSDGRTYYVPAGTRIRLKPGESITICSYMYHDFTVEDGTGEVLLGEVSTCSDDLNDNRFYDLLVRYPTIEEDEPPYRLLCNEYPPAD